jgi:hypothetical protein
MLALFVDLLLFSLYDFYVTSPGGSTSVPKYFVVEIRTRNDASSQKKIPMPMTTPPFSCQKPTYGMKIDTKNRVGSGSTLGTT